MKGSSLILSANLFGLHPQGLCAQTESFLFLFCSDVGIGAYTVIIKGTQVYNPALGSWTELSPLDIIQMVLLRPDRWKKVLPPRQEARST